MNLTPKQIQAIRIAVANVAGKDSWFRCSQHSEVTPEQATLGTLCPWCGETLEWWDGTNGPLPNYPESLDAVHEVVVGLKFGKVEQSAYAGKLIEAVNHDRHGEFRFMGASQFDQMFATAMQRCIALLMTLAPDKWLEIQNLKD